jgi:two-component system, cell cycle sensor histidine kinase and response regulator CckA
MTDLDTKQGERISDTEVMLTERFKALFEHMHEGVALHELVCDEAGHPVDYRILDVNRQFEQSMGLRRVDVAGQLATAVFKSNPPRFLAEFSSVALGGPPLKFEVHSRLRERHFSISVAPLGPKAFAVIFSDVTLSQQQAETLEKSRLAQRALIDNQPQLTWLKDCDGHFLVTNKAFADACGQPSPEAMVGKTDLDVWPKELAEAYRADDASVMRTGTQKIVEERIETVAGTRWVETYKSPVFVPDGSIVGTTGIARDITEQKRAIEARQQSERKFERVFDLTPTPIVVAKLSSEIQYVNQAFCSETGYSPEEVIGRRTVDLQLWNAPELRGLFVDYLKCEGRFGPIEVELTDRNGALRYAEMSGALVELDGQPMVVTAALDVTERKLAEARAKAAADTVEQYFSLSLDLLCIATADGRFVRLNPAWEQVLGWPIAELEGVRYLDFVHPDDILSTQDAMSRMNSGQMVLDFQNRYRTKEGSYRWLEWRSVQNAQGLVYAVARDVTRRRESEAALRAAERAAARSREQLLSVAELAHIGYFTCDVENQSGTWTSELYRILGLDPALTLPTADAFRARVHPEDLVALADAMSQAAKGQSAQLHYRIVRPDGEVRNCLGIIEGDVDERGRAVVVGQLQDLTNLRRAEEERRKLELQVMQSQKLESLGVLAGGIAHDFNNLLTSILGNADLALRELSPANPVGVYLEDIDKVSRRAAELCRQMLAYSGKGRFVVQPLSLNDVVREMGHLLSVSISKKAVVKYNFFMHLPSVMADATQVRQVVMNLITNASDAIAETSGVITLSTGVMDCDDEYLRGVVDATDAHQAGQYVFLEVSDTGCGIEPENLSRIFDPFFTTKFTGRGLGLAAVMGIVRGHRGALRVYSEVGRGTTFKVLLPAHHEPAFATDDAESPSQNWKGHGVVLLADDEQSIRSMGRRILERFGFQVLLAADGREAVEQFTKHREEIRLVVLDMTMPHLDGEACFRELRRIDPNVKVIMTSGYSEQDVVSRFVGKGLAGFVQKPYKTADLMPVVQNVLGSD